MFWPDVSPFSMFAQPILPLETTCNEVVLAKRFKASFYTSLNSFFDAKYTVDERSFSDTSLHGHC